MSTDPQPPPPIPAQPVVYQMPPQKKSRGCLIVFFLVLVFGILAIGGMVFVVNSGISGIAKNLPPRVPAPFSETVIDGSWNLGTSKPKIAMIPVEGVITSARPSFLFGGEGESMADAFQRQIAQAVGDDSVKAIILYVNSPGGEVTASDQMYQAVQAAKKVKPVVAYFDTVAASGGYYLSCGANHIVAQETGITGSIGVIIQSLNYSETFEKVGLDSKTFTSGRYKDTLSGARKMRPDEEAYIQSLVTQMYDRFVKLVSEGRNIPEGTLRAGIADGRIFIGEEAQKVGLVDATGPIQVAYAKARELSSSPDAVVVRYGPAPIGFARLFEAAASDLAPRDRTTLRLDLTEGMVPKLRSGIPYYIAPGMAGME